MKEFPEVESLLPHRAPFLFVEKIVEFDGRRVEASFHFDGELPLFRGHFPGNPIVPGVIMAEALAQTSGLLLALSSKNGAGKIFYLASNNIKFVKLVRAGETLSLKSALVREFNGLYSFSVEALSGGAQVAAGSLVLASGKEGA